MSKPILLFTVLFFTSIFSLFAQDNTTNNEFADANVVVYKDSRLYELDSRPEALSKEASKPKIVSTNKTKTTINKDSAIIKELPKMKPIVKNNRVVTGSITNRAGFRVNIYNGNDKAKAMATKGAFMRAFPAYRTYLSYNVPYYKLRVGDFEDKKTAQAFLKRVAGTFPGSFVVPDIVTVKNIVIQ